VRRAACIFTHSITHFRFIPFSFSFSVFCFSSTTRDFVQTNYKDLKTVNPTFPFLVRECEGIEAKIWARYELGVEKSISVEGLDVANVEKSVQQLVKEKPT